MTRPSQAEIDLAIKTMPRKQWYLVVSGIIILVVAVIALLAILNESYLTRVPTRGGSLTEGIIGSPRFVNPVLAVSDVDRDLTMLIYSGLMRLNAKGELENDLAKSYEVSSDGLTYSFILKDDLHWQDGKPLTADDVLFTIERLQNPTVKSPRWATWETVKVEKLAENKIAFTLKQPYYAFLENVTLGILPKHLWEKVEPEAFAFSDLNIQAVGSGPYQVSYIKFRRGAATLPEYYDLEPFENFALGAPKISSLRVRFYPNETELLTAYENGVIESLSGLSPATAKKLADTGAKILTVPLPRMFAIFFNQSQAPIFANAEVRRALNSALNRDAIIESALAGYGQAVEDPLLIDNNNVVEVTPSGEGVSSTTNNSEGVTLAIEILTKAGWKPNAETGVMEKTNKAKVVTSLSFTLATSDVPELKQVAELIKTAWEKIGAKVELKIFEIGDLNQNIIRPRQYDALFFGEALGRGADPYAFWHSSQRLDPGSNIALYTNLTVDKKLEELRKLTAPEARRVKSAEISQEILSETPAIFLYQPYFMYLTPEKIKNKNLPAINFPAERFSNINEWYIATEKVWRIFNQK